MYQEDNNTDPAEQIFRDYLSDLMEEIQEMVVPKARTYGTTELSQLGATLMHVAGQKIDSDKRAMQYAFWFYAAGKLARWTAAARRGEQPTRDTVLDLLVYCLMWLKVEETGEWWTEIETIEHEQDTTEQEQDGWGDF